VLASKGRIGTELPPTDDTDQTRAEAFYGAASPVEVPGTNISLTNKQSSCGSISCRGARHKYQPDQQAEFMRA
jgi:hypothetical protein